MRGTRNAFTLVEMLVVLGVIVVILGIAAPVVTSMKGAGDMNKAIYDIAGMVEQARAYALANNTYVYLGLGEFDEGTSIGTVPQKTGTGRIAIAAVATRDGTRSYSPYTDQVNTDWNNNNYPSGGTAAANLISIGAVQHYDNIHLLDLDPGSVPIPASGPMNRPAVTDPTFRLGNAASASATSFSYPVGSKQTGGTYVLNRVIQFDPQGQARSIPLNPPANSFYTGGVPDRIELALQPTHGNVAPAVPTSQTTGDIGVLQIDGMTGTTTIYRP